MPLSVLTPFEDKTPAVRQSPGSRVWLKRVLPVGEVLYKGRTLKFDRNYLENLAGAFNESAYDQVPFQIADGANGHTNDPERFRGEVLGMKVRDDGLYVAVLPTARGDRILEENPRLGVSARIVEDYERSDGKHFTAAMQHVLGTLDPRIPELGPWKAVEMSNDQAGQVVDLSSATYLLAGEEGNVPGLSDAEQARLDRLLALPDDQFNSLIDSVLGDGGDDDVPLTDEELAEIIAEVDDEIFAAIEEQFDAETGATAARAPVGAALSNGYDPHAIELAETQRQLGIMQAEMNANAFELEKRKLVKDTGVPPYIVDMARPLLEGQGHVVELANGQGVDAGLVMRRVITEFGRAAQLLDFTPEIGSGEDEPDTTGAGERARSELVARYRNQTGL